MDLLSKRNVQFHLKTFNVTLVLRKLFEIHMTSIYRHLSLCNFRIQLFVRLVSSSRKDEDPR